MEKRATLDQGGLRIRPHAVQIDDRQLMSVTGVKDVDSFNEGEIVLMTEAGELRIDGSDLRITRLSLDDGQVLIEGLVIALEYAQERQPRSSLISRMFG